MIWIPTFFICLSSGCAFAHFDASLSEALCKQTVANVQKQLDARKEITAYEGACLEVKLPKARLI
jgi:hypothetical protein